MMISELAARSGLAPSRIRFYETNGLLPGAQRRSNGYREFKPQNLQMLEIIGSAQQAGFTLEEIRTLLPTNPDMNKWSHEKMLETLKRKVGDIETLQKRLKKNKAQLRAIIDVVENKPDDMDCIANAERVIKILRTQPAADPTTREQGSDHLPADAGTNAAAPNADKNR
jgi:DNA-binding transcriptional MerR regulator